MTELLTAAQMRAIERAAIDSGQVTGLELMERAGRGAVDAILAEWPELGAGSGATVVCGPGNNGGDGFVVARLLKERGMRVRVLAVPSHRRSADAREVRLRWKRVGGQSRVLSHQAFRHGSPRFGRVPEIKATDFDDLWVDALLGTGARGPMDGDVRKTMNYWAGSGGDGSFFVPRTVAIDLPSGLDADSGRVPGSGPSATPGFGIPVPAARLTVTFDSPKVGHVCARGPDLCGKVMVIDIGISAWRTMRPFKPGLPANVVKPPRISLLRGPANRDERRLGRNTRMTTVADVRFGQHGFGSTPWLSLPRRPGHKFDHGHALILSGGVGRGGAARMAARGALRIGAGLVTVGCPPATVIENAAQLNAIMLRPVKDADALREMLEDARLNALCLGPGLGTAAREAALVAAALGLGRPGLDPGPRASEDGGDQGGIPKDRGPGSGAGTTKRSIVLDGDALTLIGRDPVLFGALHESCVLTPHMGEFARVFPDIAERLNAPATEAPAYSKVDAARDAAKRAGCTILLKGPDTVIAGPDRRAAVNSAHYERSVPWLATAGAGDVLAGFIAGLLARGFAPFDAACAAAWLHVECALAFGPGLIAEDLPEMLPRILARLEKDA